MRIVRANQAGFCMGVALALRKLDRAVSAARRARRDRRSVTVATLGPIIHNPQVLEEYARKGVRRLDDAREAQAGMTVLIRAHGVSREDEALLRQSGARVEDATCPRVKKAQLAIAEATARHEGLLLYGEAEHPEVKGLLSYASGPCRVFDRVDDLRACLPGVLAEWGAAGRGVVLAAQTTQDRPVFDALPKEFYACGQSMLVVLDTICDATRLRQEETLRLAGEVDAMVVVGGRQSGNTRRLADIAASRGVPAVLVETGKDLDAAFFAEAARIGLTAGASTPKSMIDEVERHLVLLGQCTNEMSPLPCKDL